MSNFKPVVDKITKLPVLNEVTGFQDYTFTAKLVSLSSTVLSLDSGTKYVIGNIDFTYPNGVEAKGVSTQIFEGNYKLGMPEVGKSYLATISKGKDGKLYTRTSHLIAGTYVEESNFDMDMFNGVAVTAEPVAVEA